MLRRLGKEEVRLGMYIHSLEGPWFDHPFWRSRFLLTDPADLQAIRDSGIAGVVVDESKSAGSAAASVQAARSEFLRQEVQREAAMAEEPRLVERPRPKPPRRVAVSVKPAPAPPSEPCSVAEEIDRAAETIERSKRTVAHLLSEVRLGRAADVATALPVVEDITASVDRNPHALVSISRMRSKDEYTYYHSISVCALMVNLARQLDHDEAAVREAGLAGLLHDFGKVVVPDNVLKKAAALTDFEVAMIREHPERGHKAIRASGYSDVVADVCLHHHERMDGGGYPHGLKGDEISLQARMAAVCDVYDAVTSRRPYKAAVGPAQSLAAMFQSEGHFDGTVLAAFIRSVGIYPVGSLVRLKSNRLALVIEQAEGDTMRPLVRIFYCIKARARIPAFDLDLQRDNEDSIASREEPVKWGFAAWDSHWAALIRATPRAAVS
ncbi:HD-GYP domain-containing protein [Sphingosinicella sp. LHD-64]|uniref:HD-GYP domain-containing protein n=1 Tax=Sphingosinicella sp. LHD-64 TaxID=3072139 RepID=UPI00280E1A2A|nr:HD-GYP domain-containing protein [Sphingosinicella sp. LHD-64]MDQ8757519.1 HD-GYP domain-containing protein [Sphingosinicella sp. LHD-64]